MPTNKINVIQSDQNLVRVSKTLFTNKKIATSNANQPKIKLVRKGDSLCAIKNYPTNSNNIQHTTNTNIDVTHHMNLNNHISLNNQINSNTRIIARKNATKNHLSAVANVNHPVGKTTVANNTNTFVINNITANMLASFANNVNILNNNNRVDNVPISMTNDINNLTNNVPASMANIIPISMSNDINNLTNNVNTGNNNIMSHNVPISMANIIPISMGNDANNLNNIIPISMSNDANKLNNIIPISMSNDANNLNNIIPISMSNDANNLNNIIPISMSNDANNLNNIIPISMTNNFPASLTTNVNTFNNHNNMLPNNKNYLINNVNNLNNNILLNNMNSLTNNVNTLNNYIPAPCTNNNNILSNNVHNNILSNNILSNNLNNNILPNNILSNNLNNNMVLKNNILAPLTINTNSLIHTINNNNILQQQPAPPLHSIYENNHIQPINMAWPDNQLPLQNTINRTNYDSHYMIPNNVMQTHTMNNVRNIFNNYMNHSINNNMNNMNMNNGNFENLQYHNFHLQNPQFAQNNDTSFCFDDDSLLNYRYKLLNLLGKGSFGKVFRSYDIIENRYVALKIIMSDNNASINQSLVEKSILQELNYYDCTKNHVVCLLDDFMWCKHRCLVFELLQGNLYELLQVTRGKGLDLNIIKTIAVKLLVSLTLLYDLDVIHCDLKPENIMVSSSCEGFVKLVDFGSSCKVGGQIFSYIQSRFYRAPEVMLELKYSRPIDIWSLGCLLAEMSTCEPLFSGRNEVDQMGHIVNYLGFPPIDMILTSRKSHKFFQFDVVHGAYRFISDPSIRCTGPFTKSLKEYLVRNKTPSVANSDSLLHNGLYGVDASFENFIYSMLNYHPDKRASPYDLMFHPFVFNVISSQLNLPRGIRVISVNTFHNVVHEYRANLNKQRIYYNTTNPHNNNNSAIDNNSFSNSMRFNQVTSFNNTMGNVLTSWVKPHPFMYNPPIDNSVYNNLNMNGYTEAVIQQPPFSDFNTLQHPVIADSNSPSTTTPYNNQRIYQPVPTNFLPPNSPQTGINITNDPSMNTTTFCINPTTNNGLHQYRTRQFSEHSFNTAVSNIQTQPNCTYDEKREQDPFWITKGVHFVPIHVTNNSFTNS